MKTTYIISLGQQSQLNCKSHLSEDHAVPRRNALPMQGFANMTILLGKYHAKQ